MKKIFPLSGTVCCSIFVFFLAFSLQAQPGSFDPEFGDNGTGKRLIEDFDMQFSGDRTLEMPDGKIMFCGGASKDNGITVFPFIGRLHPDGSTDSSFANSGYVFLDFPPLSTSPFTYSWSLLRQPDGKLLQLGRYTDTQIGKFCLFIIRYLENGLLDSTFADNGILFKTIPGYSLRSVVDLILQPDGKIIASASKSYSANSKSTLLFFRFLPDGSPDPDFGTNGIVEYDLGFYKHAAGYIELLPDGKVLAAGSTTSDLNEPVALNLLLRLNPDGSLDNTFGNEGWIAFSYGQATNQSVYDMALTPEGDIITAGYLERLDSTTQNDYAIAKFHSDGSFDETFGNGGVFMRDNQDSSDDNVSCVDIQPDGKILYVGTSVIGNTARMAFGMLNKNGTEDTDFGTNGLVTTDDFVALPNIIRQSDGTALISGQGFNNPIRTPYYVAKVLLDLNVGSFEAYTKDGLLMFYPNPVKDQALLEYELAQDQYVEVAIYTIDGARVETCLSKSLQNAGKHQEQLCISPDLQAGNYVLKITADEAVKTVRVIKI